LELKQKQRGGLRVAPIACFSCLEWPPQPAGPWQSALPTGEGPRALY